MMKALKAMRIEARRWRKYRWLLYQNHGYMIDQKVEGASGDAADILPEDVEAYITANGGTIDATSNMNISMCQIDGNRVLTLLVMDNS